jgi:hypothetical protein
MVKENLDEIQKQRDLLVKKISKEIQEFQVKYNVELGYIDTEKLSIFGIKHKVLIIENIEIKA